METFFINAANVPRYEHDLIKAAGVSKIEIHDDSMLTYSHSDPSCYIAFNFRVCINGEVLVIIREVGIGVDGYPEIKERVYVIEAKNVESN